MESYADRYIERRDNGGSLHPSKGRIRLETVDPDEVVEVRHAGWVWLYHVPEDDFDRFCEWVWVEFGELENVEPGRIDGE